MKPVDASALGAAKAGLFIDADNVDARDIESAFAVLRERGLQVTVRRAYGGFDRLGVLKDVCAGHAVKLFPNHGKGTTDASLVVDAMDLLHATGFPAVFAVASSDADFVALAVRMREAGCHTLCFANLEKADADALERVYDEVIFTSARPPKAAPVKPVAKRAAPAPAAVSSTESTAARVEALLSSLAGLKEGKPVELSEIVVLLRREKLLGRTGSGPRFLSKHAPYLRLSPEKQPNKVRWPGRTN